MSRPLDHDLHPVTVTLIRDVHLRAPPRGRDGASRNQRLDRLGDRVSCGTVADGRDPRRR